MSEQTIPDEWKLGQCVYTMSTGKRCQKEAKKVVSYGSFLAKPETLPVYGYCANHYFTITKPRNPRIHRTAEPLTRVEPTCFECNQPETDHAADCLAVN